MEKNNFLAKGFLATLLILAACNSGSNGMAEVAANPIGSVSKTDNMNEQPQSKSDGQSQGMLTVSLNFTHGNTIASNQYAVWIEDNDGNFVRTLFVTRFTGEGGYKRRADSCPTWASKAKPQEASDDEIDAVTGATPSNGKHSYTWDGMDAKGKYKVIVEGTLTPSFTSEDNTNKGMLSEVTTVCSPNK